MNDLQRAAMQMAYETLERLSCVKQTMHLLWWQIEARKPLSVLREALAHPQEHGCNQHPDAPHGFDRNASHNADRYVCECEGWQPDHVAGAGKVIELDFSKQPKQFTRF